MKRLLMVAAGGALLVALTLTVVQMPALAQQNSGTPEAGATEEEDEPGFLDALAESLGISREDLDSAIDDAQIAMIDQWAENARDSVESGESIFPGLGGGFDIRQAGPFNGVDEGRPILGAVIEHRAGEPGPFGVGGTIVSGNGVFTTGIGENLTELAGFLGLAEEDLIEQLASGATLVEIASEAGISEDDLRTYLVEQATERIDDLLNQSSAENGAADSSESSD